MLVCPEETTAKILPPVVIEPSLRSIWDQCVISKREQMISQDIDQAKTLQRLYEQRLTPQTIAEQCSLSTRRVIRLLRFAHFVDTTTMRMTELEFLRYWMQVGDPEVRRKGSSIITPEFERQVFAGIQEQVCAGREAKRVGSPRHRKLTAAKILCMKNPLVRLVKEQDKILKNTVMPLVRELKALLHVPQAMMSPVLIGQLSIQLDNATKEWGGFLTEAMKVIAVHSDTQQSV